MPKIKTHSASKKRFSLTKSGKIKMNHSHHRHNLGHKTAKRKRNLRKASYLGSTTSANVKRLVPYM